MKVLEQLRGTGFALVTPYAAWMVLMTALPATDWAYGVRTVVTAALLAATWWSRRGAEVRSGRASSAGAVSGALWGIGTGLVVLAIWILPDSLPWYREWCVLGDPYSSAAPPPGFPTPCCLAEVPALTWLRLFGSAFVISAAEELFFRKWLIGFAGFWGMAALFAVEHNRYAVGAVAGILYGLLFLRRGLLPAIVAHATTNLLLGLYVIHTGHWEFW